MDDLIVRFSHHSSALENNTISLPETVSILLHDTIPNRMSLREVYEIDNHRYTMEYLFSEDVLKEEFSLDILLETHSILMDKLHHERGSFKKEGNYIKGADFETARPEETYMLMKQWVDNVNYRMEMASSKEAIFEIVCESHITFERIHPFADGNGRIGRLILNHLLVRNNLASLVIEKEEKERYFFILATQDVDGFVDFAKKKIKKEEKRMKAFLRNKNNQQIDFDM